MKVKDLIEELSKHNPEALVTVEQDRDVWEDTGRFSVIRRIRKEDLRSVRAQTKNLPPEYYVVLTLDLGKSFDEMTDEEKNKAFEDYLDTPYTPDMEGDE